MNWYLDRAFLRFDVVQFSNRHNENVGTFLIQFVDETRDQVVIDCKFGELADRLRTFDLDNIKGFIEL